MLKLIAICSILAMLAIGSTYALNVQNIEENDRNVDSYHDWSPWIYVIAGGFCFFISIYTFRLHLLAGTFSIGFGFLSLSYGIYLLSIKTGVLV